MTEYEKQEPESVEQEPVEEDLDDVSHVEFKRDDSSQRETRETKNK